MTLKFILAQITALTAWIFFMSSYHAKRENKIILLQVFSGAFYTLSYFLGGATTGFLISLFETCIALAYYKSDKDKYIYMCTIPVYIMIGWFSRSDGWLVIIPVAAALIDGYGLIRNNKIMVICGTISNALWIYYDLYFLEYVTALGDFFLVVSNASIILYGLYKYINRDKVKLSSVKDLTDEDMNVIKHLDETCYDSIYRWPLSKLQELYLREKDSYIIIKYKNEIVGYINFLNVTEETYNKVMSSDELIDSYENEEIIPYHRNKKLYINMNSIVLKREYNNKKIVKRIETEINRYINKKLRSNYKIRQIFIYTVNEFEEKIVKQLGFKQVKKITDECILYSKDIRSFKLI